MLRIYLFTLLFASAIIQSGCAANNDSRLTQFSTIDALLAGAYDGQFTCADVLEHGNTGIGTFDKLDGEMIIIDGTVYQAKADGTIAIADKSMKTPFASAVFFKTEKTLAVSKKLSQEDFIKTVDTMQTNPNLFTAFRADANFKSIKVRSVPAQQKPYPPLVKITAKQSEFNFNNISGTLIGFKCPPFVKGVNVPGYHVHFISNDRKTGGHVLNFEMSEGRIETAAYSEFFMLLPDKDSIFAKTDMAADRSAELEKAEK